MERAWPKARITAAPTGSDSDQSGQSVLVLPGRASKPMAPTITSVPIASGQVRLSSSQRMPITAAKSGEVEAMVAASVGPR